ncbi:MAG: asparagine synthase (glutamine-hydrolyzing) [Caldilineaceae bacterium]|nr:asparagine synthase (glutamine-hydrolyzing) [Caldilineaceae bacterium]
MSGIVGILHFDGKPVAAGQIEQMTAAMAYRGPDGIDHWIDGAVGLGQCMLRTTPEAQEETQPLANEEQSVILVMDGRVDNWESLRQQLLAQGAVLRSRADAELVLRSYERWGKACVNHLEGDFALAIWDVKRQTLFCARDPLGNKPFHYHWRGNTFVFASELHPILALPWVPERVNEGLLAEFLAADWSTRDETLWQGIGRLMAAHTLEANAHGLTLAQYWQPDLGMTLPYTTEQEYVEHYRALVFESVRRQSRSQQPVAVEVSGGLDSSAVFGVAEHLRRTRHLPAPALAGYTFAFTDNGVANSSAADELAYARAIGDYWSTPIQEIAPTMPPLAWYAEQANRYRDFVGFPNGAMSLTLRQTAAQQGSRVILTGEGGDQWANGTRYYYAEALSQRHWWALYGCLHADVAAFGLKQTASWFWRYGCLPTLPTALQAAYRRFPRIRPNSTLLTPSARFWLTGIQAESVSKRRGAANANGRSLDQQDLLTKLTLPFYAQVMERAERDTARAGLELRHPLHTPQLAQLALATPARFRLRGDVSKVLHRQAFRELMPATVVARKDKAEFSVAFRTRLDEMQPLLTETIPQRRPTWITAQGMTQLYQFYQHNPQRGWPLWILWSIYLCDVILPTE